MDNSISQSLLNEDGDGLAQVAPLIAPTTTADADNDVDGADNEDADSSGTPLAKKALLAANFFVETNRMESFTAVYLVAFKNWSETSFGIVSLVMNLISVVSSTPAGDIMDKTKKKKHITALAILIAAVTTASPAFTSNFTAILFLKAAEGIASTFFLPALMSLLLGIVSSKDEVPSFTAKTEVSNKIGTLLITIGIALITYYQYPDIEEMFYVLGAAGVFAVISIVMIPNSAINNDRARGLENADDFANTSVRRSFHSQLSFQAVEKQSNNNIAKSETKSDAEHKDADIENLVKDKQVSPYSELLKDRNILAYAVVTFIYHLANAAILPLLSQYLAISIEDKRYSMVFAAGLVIVTMFFQGITAHWMIKAVKKYDPKTLLVVAHFILPIRAGLIAAMIKYWNNVYALAATQILEGVGAGIYDTMIPAVVSRMTKGSGRFGFSFGFILTCWRIGHGFSLLAGETVTHEAGYEVAFLMEGSIGLVSMMVLIVFVHIKD